MVGSQPPNQKCAVAGERERSLDDTGCVSSYVYTTYSFLRKFRVGDLPCFPANCYRTFRNRIASRSGITSSFVTAGRRVTAPLEIGPRTEIDGHGESEDEQ